MSRRNVLVLSCMLAALHGQAQAGAQQDPSSNPEIVKLADVSSDCVARHYLTARDAARQDPENRDALLKASLNDAVRRCRREIRLLRDRYEEVFGPGMGYAFLKQSYFPDLKRAVMERVLDTPDRRQQVTALQKNHRYISGGDTDACRYKFLLDKGIQEKVNRVVAGIKLREDLI